MNIGFTQITANLGMDLDIIILLVVNIGLLITYAKGFQLGTLLAFIANSLLTIWFYAAGYNYGYPMVLMFTFLVILCLSIYSVSKTTEQGTFI